jgi:hypothetical protein
MVAAVTAAFTALLGWFIQVFDTVTEAGVVEWVVFGIAVAVLSVGIKFFRRIVWGA